MAWSQRRCSSQQTRKNAIYRGHNQTLPRSIFPRPRVEENKDMSVWTAVKSKMTILRNTPFLSQVSLIMSLDGPSLGNGTEVEQRRGWPIFDIPTG